MSHDGVKRFYHAHLPPSYSGDRPVPVVVVLHGGGGTWVGARKGSQMDLSADAHGFIAVYPNSGKSKRWNIGSRKKKKAESDLDDIGFFRAMLDDLAKKFNIDQSRIYFAGLSNGGFMSYRVACEMPDRVAAVAALGCALPFSDCPPGRPVPVMHIHGTADRWIPFEGGQVKTMGDVVPPTQAVVGFWRERNGCAEPVSSYRGKEAACVTSDCEAGSQVTFCAIEGGGHVWPGGEYENDRPWYKKAVGHLSRDFIAREEIWKFFSRHRRG